MKELFEKYGNILQNCINCDDEFCCHAGKDDWFPPTCYKYPLPKLTPDKVLALEEVVFDIQQEDFYQYKLSKGKWCYQWKREYFVKDTRINALCSLLIYLHQYFNEQEREQIKQILES